MTIKNVENRFLDKKLILLSNYINTDTPVKCKCRCGEIFWVKPHLVFYRNKDSCGCNTKMYQYIPGSKNYKWKGYGEISAKLWDSIQAGAEHRKLKFDIDIEYIWNLFEKQNRLCAITKRELRFPASSKDSLYTASLDRIDPSGGYVDGNLWWVHKEINETKWDMTLERYIELCDLIVNPIQDISNESCIIYNHNPGYKGVGNVSGNHFSSIKHTAKKRNIPFYITKKMLWNLFLSQNGRCAITGLQIFLPRTNKDIRIASLDRINNNKGYYKDNIQWVHKDINQKFKKHYSQEKIIEIATIVMENFSYEDYKNYCKK